jgi:hypothetical protein
MPQAVRVSGYVAPEAVPGRGIGAHSLAAQDGEHARRFAVLSERIRAYSVAERCAPVRVGWQALSGLATSATWDVSPVADSPASEAAAAVVRRVLGLGGASSPVIEWEGRIIALPSWESRLRDLLRGALMGFSLAEMVAYPYEGTTYVDLEPRDQSSVRQWVYDRDGRVVAVDQWRREPVGLSSMVSVRLPYERLVHLVYPSPAAGVEGLGIMRHIEPLATDYTATMRLRAVAMQRTAVPVPTISIDEEALGRSARSDGGPPDVSSIESARTALLDIARKWSSHEEAALVMPSWATLAWEGRPDSAAPLSGVVADLERQILQACYVQHLAMGSASSSGSYSTAQVHADLAAQLAGDLCQWVAEGLAPYVRTIVALNIGPLPLAELPRLTYAGIRSPLWVEHIPDVVSLLASGALTPSPDDERTIRAALELAPPSSAADGRSERARVAGTVAMTPPPGALPGGL